MNLAIIQARMDSSRLPGKVLMEIEGKPMLEFMHRRVKKSKLIDKIIIATTIKKNDNPIIDLCKKKNFLYYRGSENDVLDRYYKSALAYNPILYVIETMKTILALPRLPTIIILATLISSVNGITWRFSSASCADGNPFQNNNIKVDYVSR